MDYQNPTNVPDFLQDDEWEEVGAGESLLWNFEEKSVLIGAYQGKKENVGVNNSAIHSVKTDDGEVVSFWGSTLLDDRLSRVPVGVRVKIEYLGEAVSEKTKRKYKNFKVYMAKTQMSEV